jgi:hypothetical protein
LDILYTTLDRLWCKARGEVEPFDHLDEIWVCIGEEGGADERRRASMTPRAVLGLSSWWSPLVVMRKHRSDDQGTI